MIPLTEQRNPRSKTVDLKSSLQIVDLFNQEDRCTLQAVSKARKSIAQAIDWVTQAFKNGGRLIYVGAGTSGRLGALDASECPPTFGVSYKTVLTVMAGGNRAITRSVEGAEDSFTVGGKDLEKRNPSSKDVVLGIAASGRTPYVRGALQKARQLGAKTILLSCAPLNESKTFVDLLLVVPTGPEVLTGSTRLKAGTATKMVLNMITTGAMIRNGKTYENLMVDVACSNQKLVRRGIRILQTISKLPENKARALLKKANMKVKVALAMHFLQTDRKTAEKALVQHKGFLRKLI